MEKEAAGRQAILMLLILTVLAMNIMLMLQFGYGERLSDGTGANIKMMDSALIEKMNFSTDSLTSAVGGQLVPMLTVEPANSVEKVVWTSSDSTIADVSISGTVTTYRSGQAVITAKSKNCSASFTVTVTSDIFAQTGFTVIELMNNAADADVFNRACQLRDQLARCTEAGADKLSALMTNILDYGMGGGNISQLESAIAAMPNIGLNRERCLIAAMSCKARWEKASSTAVISFAGDCTFARFNEQETSAQFPAIYRLSGSETYPFDKIKGVFAADSLTNVNLECALTGSTQHRDKQFYFRGDKAYTKILTGSSVETVNLSNNHSGDYFDNGRTDTINALKEVGIDYCFNGAPCVRELLPGSGIKLCMISYSLVNTEYTKEIREELNSLVQANKNENTIVAVILHWGVEKAVMPEAWQITAAHELADSGADLIIGHHPHVLQGIEQYAGAYIAYSLGNFSFGGNSSVSNPETIILRVRLTAANGVISVSGLSAVPCKTTSTGTDVNNYQVMPQFGEAGQAVINRMLVLSGALDGGITNLEWSGI